MRLLNELDLKDKRVFIRVDFNVPLQHGEVSDATRIEAAMPTVRHALREGGRVILASHLGRPKGKVDSAYSLEPVRKVLSTLLNKQVPLAPDCVGPEAEALAEGLQPGDVLLLENLRFHAEEEKNDEPFARALARLADVYVNDAFGTAHRAHASTVGMVPFVSEHAAGFLLKRECEYLSKVLESPARPLVAILGGAKVSDKIKVIRSLLARVDTLLIGGAMAYTFLRAQGEPTGRSLVEADQVGLAGDLVTEAAQRNVALILPIDHVVAPDSKHPDAAATVRQIPEDQMALDIGPETIGRFREALAKAQTVFWNGPLGMFEVPPFDAGTVAIATAVADSQATSIIGGGDSVAAVIRSGRADDISHISTGGGASLEFVEGETLPGLAALEAS